MEIIQNGILGYGHGTRGTVGSIGMVLTVIFNPFFTMIAIHGRGGGGGARGRSTFSLQRSLGKVQGQ